MSVLAALRTHLPSVKKGLRAYDIAVLTISIVVALSYPEIAGRASAVALLVFAAMLLMAGSLQLRFAYGSPADVGALLLSALAAVTVALALPTHGADATAEYLWAAAVLLIMLPRLAASLLYPTLLPVVGKGRGQPIVRPGDHPHARTAWIISLTSPVDEPRVRRQADALWHARWNVIVMGYAGVSKKPAFWTLVELFEGQAESRGGLREQIGSYFDPPLRALLRTLLFPLARFSVRMAEWCYWLDGRWDRRLGEIRTIALQHGFRCDLVANHDYYTTPIAAKLALEWGAPFSTDVHEYATGQYMHRFSFRLLTRHYVHSLQRLFYPQAAILSVVCQGIADLLRLEYPLQRPPVVVRNVSFYEQMPFRAPGESMHVLYHGILYEARGLEEAIRSMPLWRPEFHLVIRGPGSEDYVRSLLDLARRVGVEKRLRVEPPVPLTELVAAANRYDIGFFASADYSPQKKFTAPNKLFEYVMAGLALCVSDLPEMRKVVVDHDVGRTFADLRPETIAAAINGFEPVSISAYKRRSLEAAKMLCWEHERQKLMDAYEMVYRSHAAVT